MADVVMGVMGSLVPKLHELLKEEYKLQRDAKERVKSLTVELEAAQAALRKVAQVPWDELDEQVKVWAREVRESSYDMEDVLDTFLVHVQQGRCDSKESSSLPKRLGDKMATLFTKSKARRKISIDAEDIMSHLDEVTARCRRYKVDDIVARPSTASAVDPRLTAMYNKVNSLVGIHESSADLISTLQLPSPKMKIVSVVGVGGLGKTTLAKAVHDKVKGDFARWAFVPVGRNPDLTKVIQGILIQLDKERYMQFNFGLFHHITQFIDELREFLHANKRYFIVIDDIWEVQSLETIKLAFDDDNSCGGRVLITTRKMHVATKADEVYMLPPLPYASSRELFYSRISGDNEGRRVDNNQPDDEVSDEILKKCGGIPLAIITMASLLVGKPRDRWHDIYKSVGFGQIDNKEAAAKNNIMRILSFSYYDLPSHLRTCLLYLSAFPEDSFIPRESLVWKWVAESFVHKVQGLSLFEVGEGYFNDLINRSLIQEAVDSSNANILAWTFHGCRVHDIVLDFIRSMSHDENFFTILENNDHQVTLPHSNVRRLAHHNRATHHQANHFVDMPKMRSFCAHGCVVETWAPLPSLALLRVLALENCNPTDGSRIRIEHVQHLLHLSISSLTQLMCFRITFDKAPDCEAVCWLERLTSLEELQINVFSTARWAVKDLSILRELRVLKVDFNYDKETERELVESLRHLHKLQHLSIVAGLYYSGATWEAAGFVLPRHLRLLATCGLEFPKLPSCINPWCLPNLSWLELTLKKVDEQDLKILGRLPELRYLQLFLGSSATISNIVSGDSADDAVYFPKLRCWRLPESMVVLFLGNKEDKGASFHLWDGEDDIAMPSAAAAAADDDELATDRTRKLQHWLVRLACYCLLALFQQVVAFVRRKWFISGPGNGRDATAMPSASVDENKASKDDAAIPRFMPRLQVLHFHARQRAVREHRRYCHNLGLEYLPALREISVDIEVPDRWASDAADGEHMEAALRCAAELHPNRPTIHIEKRREWW
ncbi:unnamed protein product [Urochloa decumbens]|uniref:AAA+ ATPase domain-containing protein n=1 Tax=Urochloa decumbens TaxID=240449 RepID=A0ABC9AS68_9POAL